MLRCVRRLPSLLPPRRRHPLAQHHHNHHRHQGEYDPKAAAELGWKADPKVAVQKNFAAVAGDVYDTVSGRVKVLRFRCAAPLDTIHHRPSGTSTTHNARNYPIILAGGKNLGLKHGRFLKQSQERPLGDLFVKRSRRQLQPVARAGAVVRRPPCSALLVGGCLRGS